MKSKNPIERRLRARVIKGIAESFLGSKHFSWIALFYASLTMLVAGWFPTGIAELIEGKMHEGSYKVVGAIILLFFIGFTLRKITRYKSRIEVKCEPPFPSKILVIFLSPLIRTLKPDDLEKELTISSDKPLEDILDGTEWEMPWRAIKYHYDSRRLEKVYVLTSKQTSGLMPLFEKVMRRLFPPLEVEEFLKGGIDFQDIKMVFEMIEDLFDKLRASGIKDDNVIVDVTGGQVPNSIAGAIVTLAFGRRFQYVSTRDKKVLSYDVGYFED